MSTAILNHLETPQAKQTRRECPICQGTGWEIVQAAGQASMAKPCICRQATKIVRLRNEVGVPARYDRCELEKFQELNPTLQKAREAAARFIERYPRWSSGLFFTGPAGVGKTHLAVAILKEIFPLRGENLRFCDWRALPAVVPGQPDVWRQLADADLLVLDDFGSGPATADRLEAASFLLHARYNARKLTVLTGGPLRWAATFGRGPRRPGNEKPLSHTERFIRQLDPGTRFRLAEMCRIVPVRGEDYRRLFPRTTSLF